MALKAVLNCFQINKTMIEDTVPKYIYIYILKHSDFFPKQRSYKTIHSYLLHGNGLSLLRKKDLPKIAGK